MDQNQMEWLLYSAIHKTAYDTVVGAYLPLLMLLMFLSVGSLIIIKVCHPRMAPTRKKFPSHVGVASLTVPAVAAEPGMPYLAHTGGPQPGGQPIEQSKA